ncbi:MAG: inverse autotransporter beta domain-containing protein [Candidatus Symbiodolus clandestinus]
MQRSRKELLIEGLLFFCSAWALLPLQAAVHCDPTAAQQLRQLATEWTNQFGQSAVVLTPPLSKCGLCSGYGELLLPLRQQGQQLLLTQLGLQHDSSQTTYNIGVGQRHLTRSPGYWGYNLFYDYRRQGNHSRLGLGLERHGAQGMIRLNGYLPLSNWRFDVKNTLQSRPAEGIDLQLQRTICQQPYLRVQLLLTHYFSHSLAREAEKQSPPGSSTATVGFDYAPVPLFNASYGYQISSGGLRTHQLQFSLIYRLGVPLAQQFDPHQVVNAYSLNNSHFELIKRQARIVLQQRSGPVESTVAPEESEEPEESKESEKPKDTSQVSIPSPQSGKPVVIPDQGLSSPTIASQPDSFVSTDTKPYQHPAPSGSSKEIPMTENALCSKSNHRRVSNSRRVSMESVSTTTSSAEIPEKSRARTVYQVKTTNGNVGEFVKNKLTKYNKNMKTIVENQKDHEITPDTNERIDLNNISAEHLLKIKGVGPKTATTILFIQDITDKQGTLQDYENGVTLLEKPAHENVAYQIPVSGINDLHIKQDTKNLLLNKRNFF